VNDQPTTSKMSSAEEVKEMLDQARNRLNNIKAEMSDRLLTYCRIEPEDPPQGDLSENCLPAYFEELRTMICGMKLDMAEIESVLRRMEL